MKRILLSLLIIYTLPSFSQNFGNEWISYTQKYYKIAVTKKGIHRITVSDLITAGVPTGDIDPVYLQLFSKGQEQYIYVNGAADRVFNGNDYIEFYGEPNNGWLDTVFYNDASQQVNSNYSMINDTSWYFLTLNTSGVAKRFIEENDQNFSSYTATDYCMKEVRQDYVSNYNSASEGSYYNDGEGWIDSPFDYTTTSSKTIATPNYINKSVKSTVSFCFVGANSTGHHLRVTGLGIILDTSFYGYKTIKKSYSISTALTASSILNAKSITGTTDNNAWAWASIRYSHSMNFENSTSFAFALPTITASKYRLDITNFNGDSATVFYDLTNHKRITPTNNSGIYQVLLNNESNTPNCYISSGTDFIRPASIQTISSQNASLAYFSDFRILKAGYIIVTNKQLWAKAKEYADYRTLKGYNVVLLDVDELYNQFAYGINKHPAAIRNFCRYALKNSSVKPEFLFLIGKSLHTKLYRNDASLYATCLVPSAGMPVSDALFSWKLGTGYTPVIATGRLAATSLTDVDWYFNKVKEYEDCQPSAWMKNVLQFAGGADIGQQTIMKNYVLNYGRIFEDTLFGAITQNYFKNSSQPVGSTQTDIIRQSINNGVSILNFFGHASATGFDQDINRPSTYDNKGKYPLLMANSCYSGDINNSGTKGISEQWVIIKDKGTIGFLANVDVGYTFYLDLFSEELVRNISYKNYQGAIGISINNAIKANENRYPTSDYMKFTALDMVLHGDPAIKTYGFFKPDLVANEKYISFKPTRLTTDIDSFQVSYAVVNEGRAFADSFQVQIKRSFPNGKTSSKSFWIHGVKSIDTLKFYLPIGGLAGTGINKIEITLDASDSIVELNEANNSVIYSFVINSVDLLPVYPYKYAIYPNDTVEFLACSPDPYIGNKTAKCQLDVSPYFDSQSLLTATSQYDNGIFKWKFPAKFLSNQIYYWRVAIDNGNNNFKWSTSSFIYIPGKTGWSQAQFYQFKEDDYQYLVWDEVNKTFSYIQTPKHLMCRTVGTPGGDQTKWKNVQFTIDGSMQGWSSCNVGPAFNVAVFDSSTVQAWQTNRGDYGHRNYPYCASAGSSPQNYFTFTSSDATSRIKMSNLLSDTVPNGDYILVFTWQSGNFASMEESVIQKFEALGAKQIRSLVNASKNDIPYIFFVKKGSPETEQEIVGTDQFSQIELNVDLQSHYYAGTINSTLIGPSKHWSRFVKDMPQNDSSDINRFSITAVNQKSQEYQAMSQLQNNVDTLSNVVNASLYPYMRLSMTTSDKILRTAGQLKVWQVYYDEYPDGAVSITPQSKFYTDTLQEGDNMKMVISFKNISKYPMDSILVSYTITNDKNALIQLITKKIKPLSAGETLTDSISFSTTGHTGTNLLTVEFNPFNSNKGTYDQLEQYHFNNLALKYFHVLKDKKNPLFDVTFDGIHIMNGDIVSSKPEIKISLKDENKFFILDDTSLIEVYIKSLNDNKEHRLQFSSGSSAGNLVFSPGTSTNNKATVSYSPVFTDGIYQLRIKGKDKSGNESGNSDYTITFEIITKSSITNLINYPNPFTTATRFVFTLTGSEIPSDLRIQIFTITGKLVKEISLAELGSLHIGRNITEFAWDGTDAYGDKLANGVYLYRVFTSIKGTEIEHRSTEIDQYFKKGFGKMYLMR